MSEGQGRGRVFASFSEKEGGLRGGVVSRRFINMSEYVYNGEVKNAKQKRYIES